MGEYRDGAEWVEVSDLAHASGATPRDGYWVSDDGRVASQRAHAGRVDPARWRELRTMERHTGHLAVKVATHEHRAGVICRVHRLVARHFLGAGADDEVVVHNDGDPTNNAANNLRWATLAENSDDMRVHRRAGLTMHRSVLAARARHPEWCEPSPVTPMDDPARWCVDTYCAGRTTLAELARVCGVPLSRVATWVA